MMTISECLPDDEEIYKSQDDWVCFIKNTESVAEAFFDKQDFELIEMWA